MFSIPSHLKSLSCAVMLREPKKCCHLHRKEGLFNNKSKKSTWYVLDAKTWTRRIDELALLAADSFAVFCSFHWSHGTKRIFAKINRRSREQMIGQGWKTLILSFRFSIRNKLKSSCSDFSLSPRVALICCFGFRIFSDQFRTRHFGWLWNYTFSEAWMPGVHHC